MFHDVYKFWMFVCFFFHSGTRDPRVGTRTATVVQLLVIGLLYGCSLNFCSDFEVKFLS